MLKYEDSVIPVTSLRNITAGVCCVGNDHQKPRINFVFDFESEEAASEYQFVRGEICSSHPDRFISKLLKTRGNFAQKGRSAAQKLNFHNESEKRQWGVILGHVGLRGLRTSMHNNDIKVYRASVQDDCLELELEVIPHFKNKDDSFSDNQKKIQAASKPQTIPTNRKVKILKESWEGTEIIRLMAVCEELGLDPIFSS